jgi:hypothetical protein
MEKAVTPGMARGKKKSVLIFGVSKQSFEKLGI